MVLTLSGFSLSGTQMPNSVSMFPAFWLSPSPRSSDHISTALKAMGPRSSSQSALVTGSYGPLSGANPMRGQYQCHDKTVLSFDQNEISSN